MMINSILKGFAGKAKKILVKKGLTLAIEIFTELLREIQHDNSINDNKNFRNHL